MASAQKFRGPAATKKPAPTMEPAEKKIGGAKNGGKRMIAAPGTQAPKYYPSEDKPVAKKTRKTLRPTRLRSSITPGTVLILLAGRFRGKRVVFLKQLASGLLLVTGPFKINGVPLRRVNQAYVIATSTKVDISSVEVDAKFTDAYFAQESGKSKDREAEFFNDGSESKDSKKASPERSSDQKAVDKSLISIIKKQPLLANYLNATFGLSKGEYPHRMQF